jgi:hypothetical protein
VYRIGSDLGSRSPDEKRGYMDMTHIMTTLSYTEDFLPVLKYAVYDFSILW